MGLYLLRDFHEHHPETARLLRFDPVFAKATRKPRLVIKLKRSFALLLM
jgi:hypothetical protein